MYIDSRTTFSGGWVERAPPPQGSRLIDKKLPS